MKQRRFRPIYFRIGAKKAVWSAAYQQKTTSLLLRKQLRQRAAKVRFSYLLTAKIHENLWPKIRIELRQTTVNALFGMVDHRNVEAMAMRWLKRNLRKIGSIIVVVALLVWMVWISFLVVEVQPGPVPAANTGMVQAMPTVDVTAVAIDQLKQQDEKLQRDNSFPWTLLNAVGGSIGTTLVAAAAIITAWLGWRQWLTNRKDELKKRREDQRSEQEKRAEERFQAVVEGLGSERIEARVGAAIMLRTFLQPGYEKFYQQTFDLAVTHLRLRSIDPNTPEPLDPNEYVPLDSLSQALITVFKESFPLARNRLDQEESQFEIEIKSLDASHIRLDNAYLRGADLKNVQMREASLIKAELRKADLRHAYLTEADLSRANLRKAILSGTRLHNADLRHAFLREAHLDRAYLRGANFDGARLNGAYLTGANFDGEPRLDKANLDGADLRRAEGITKEQLEACKTKGAIIDEDSTTNTSQSTVTIPSLSQSNDVLASSTPPAQGSLPTSNAGKSNAASSQQELES
jgi:uncharacterized protein YjbI with pentapeptide repeats